MDTRIGQASLEAHVIQLVQVLVPPLVLRILSSVQACIQLGTTRLIPFHHVLL